MARRRWTFVVWGALHGSYLIINHGWRELRTRLGLSSEASSHFGIWLARTITFLFVVVAWVFFRAADMDAALNMLSAMAGIHGIAAPASLPQFTPDVSLSTASVDSSADWVSQAYCCYWRGLHQHQQITGYVGPEGAYGSAQLSPAQQH